MAAQYIVTDRTTGDEYAITIDDGIVNWGVVVSVASAEPIFEDDTNAGTYWKLYIDNTVLGWEITATVQDDNVELVDSVTGTTYRLGVNDGVFNIFSTDVITVGRFRVVKISAMYNTSRSEQDFAVARI